MKVVLLFPDVKIADLKPARFLKTAVFTLCARGQTLCRAHVIYILRAPTGNGWCIFIV